MIPRWDYSVSGRTPRFIFRLHPLSVKPPAADETYRIGKFWVNSVRLLEAGNSGWGGKGVSAHLFEGVSHSRRGGREPKHKPERSRVGDLFPLHAKRGYSMFWGVPFFSVIFFSYYIFYIILYIILFSFLWKITKYPNYSCTCKFFLPFGLLKKLINIFA